MNCLDELDKHFMIELSNTLEEQRMMVHGNKDYNNILRGKVAAYQDVLEQIEIMKDREEEDILLTKQNPIKKPTIKKNKFANLSKEDWKETNESTKINRELSGLAYQNIITVKDEW